MLTGQLDFLHLFQSCPKSITLNPWKEQKNAKSVPIGDTWESQLSLWSLAPGLCYHFSIAASHGLVEYRVCSSQPDSWSFLKREGSEFGPTEAKAGIKSQSLTYCSLQSIEHCTQLWILHLLLLLHADLHATSALSLPAGASPRVIWVKCCPSHEKHLIMHIHLVPVSADRMLKSKAAPMIFRPLQGPDGIRKRDLQNQSWTLFLLAKIRCNLCVQELLWKGNFHIWD